MATKTDRTKPGSKNDWRLTYNTGSKKWTNDRPGDGKGDPEEKEDLSDDLTIKRALERLEKAVNGYIKGKGDKGIKDAVESFEQYAGTDNARTVIREVYSVEKKQSDSKESDMQKKVVEGLSIAKKHLNRDRKAAMAARVTEDIVKESESFDSRRKKRGKLTSDSDIGELDLLPRRCKNVDANLKDVANKIIRRFQDQRIVKNLLEKVKKYTETKNDRDDISLQESRDIYRPYNYGETLPLSKKRDLNIDWTDHAEYRSDLRDIKPNIVNRLIRDWLKERLMKKGPDKKKVKMKLPGTGTAVVDYDLTRKPSDADVVTVWASEDELIDTLRRMGVHGLGDGRTAADIRWQAIFLIGPPGAGKSWFRSKKYLKYMQFKLVDPDEIKKEHPDYDPEEPYKVHVWSKGVADSKFKSIVSDGDGEPVVVDGTGRDSMGIAKKVKMANAAGYRTFLVFVYVPWQVSIFRNRNRPRFVPEDKVLHTNNAVMSSFRALKGMVDRFKVIVNFEASEEREAKKDMAIYPPPQAKRPPRPGDEDYGMERAASLGRAARAMVAKIIDDLPRDIKTLWYENDKGERSYPDFDQGPDQLPDGFKYQHSRFPNMLRHNMLKITQKDEVENCDHPEDSVQPTGGWIDGIEGRECHQCGGTQTKNVNEQWPDEWDAHGSTSLGAMESSFSEDLVLALVDKADMKLSDAIIIAANCCERCMNVMADELGLDWGYSEDSEDAGKAGTSCALCTEGEEL